MCARACGAVRCVAKCAESPRSHALQRIKRIKPAPTHPRTLAPAVRRTRTYTRSHSTGALTTHRSTSTTVYVGKLWPLTRDTQIYELFSTVGPIKKLTMVRDADPAAARQPDGPARWTRPMDQRNGHRTAAGTARMDCV